MPADLTFLKTFPAPWSKDFTDAEGKRVLVAGYSTTGSSCFPTSSTQAHAWLRKHKRNGARLIRPHHIDKFLIANWGAHGPRLNYYFGAAKSKGIPLAVEFCSEAFEKSRLAKGDFAGWSEHVKRFCGDVDLSNVVMACPVNEPAPTSQAVFDAQCELIRKAGYKGLLFGSNASIQGGPMGEIETAHVYAGHPEKKEVNGQTIRYAFAVKYPNWSTWNKQYPDGTAGFERLDKSKPLAMLEGGSPWPNPFRQESEIALYSRMLTLGAQAILPYAYATSHEDMLSGVAIDRDPEGWPMAADEARMEAFRWLACKMQGVEYVMNAGVPLEAVPDPFYPNAPTFTYRALTGAVPA
jgi:hypothetical protein